MSYVDFDIFILLGLRYKGRTAYVLGRMQYAPTNDVLLYGLWSATLPVGIDLNLQQAVKFAEDLANGKNYDNFNP